MPGRVRAQDLKQVDSIASRPPAIKLWQVGAVAGAGLLTMAPLDEPVQHWVSNPANRSGTINDMPVPPVTSARRKW